MALNQVKTVMENTDVYGRYFAYNVFEVAFKTLDDAKKQTSLVDSIVEKLYNDEKYGLGKVSTLYQWVKAMNEGPESAIYKEIFDNFKDTKWTTKQMDQFVGPASAMKMMNNTFGYNVAKYLGDHSQITGEELSARQWNSRALTENKDVPFVQGNVKSVYDFYKQEFEGKIKDISKVINLANYTLELGHYMTEVLGYEISDVQMSLP